ncbi:MAG: glucose 1-dehydrogenase [Comamonadaceae bacterium]|nr:glucose 1-dehydrogenase [Comamonadaceae bacterium]
MDRLKDKVALVTGGAMGIGEAISRLIASEGARVAVTDLDDGRGEAVVAAIRERGGQAAYWHLDVSDEAQVGRVFAEVRQRFGPITALINNAGIAGPNKPTHELSVEEFERVQAVNVRGVFLGTKHVIAQMREAGGGSIVNLSSIYGLVGGADVPPYHASKGAVRMMTKTDALLYAADRIRVNSVHPGFIWTPMVDGFLKTQADPAAARAATAALHPLGHMGEPDDIGWACVYLASDESKFVTGSELVVDGGYTCR